MLNTFNNEDRVVHTSCAYVGTIKDLWWSDVWGTMAFVVFDNGIQKHIPIGELDKQCETE